MKTIAIIPARYGSTRFEGKPLIDLLGKPMIQRVYEGVCQSRLVDKVVVATDDRRIFDTVQRFGGHATMTSPAHPTGTDRIAEVARKVKADIVVNVQGDEPLIRGEIIDKAIRPLIKDPGIPMATLAATLENVSDWLNPNVTKAVVDRQGFALYFSRSPIPFPQGLEMGQLFSDPLIRDGVLLKGVLKHIGLYVFRRDFLLRFARMKPTRLETLEKLEQLRAIENGYRIKVTPVDYLPLHIDTPADLPKVLSYLSRQR